MPDGTPAPRSGTKPNMDFLTRKVGPFPVLVWALMIAGAYLLYTHYKGGSAATVAADSSIDPVTGESYAQEYGAAQSQLATSSGSQASGGTGQFADNDAWATAAINYLVGIGVDPSVASQAIENYLGSIAQPNPQYQAEVNSAITALGPPPSIPGPATANPSPIATGTCPTGYNYSATNPGSSGVIAATNGSGFCVPTGAAGATKAPGAVSDITVTPAASGTITAAWRPPQFASEAPYSTTYNIGISPAPVNGSAGMHDIGSRTSYNISGIKKGTSYTIKIQPQNSAGKGPTSTKSYKAA